MWSDRDRAAKRGLLSTLLRARSRLPASNASQGLIADARAVDTSTANITLAISNNQVAAANEVAHLITNGSPSVREFYDVRLRKSRPRHIQTEQNFTLDINFLNDAITIGTVSGGDYYRIMAYAIGILLSAL